VYLCHFLQLSQTPPPNITNDCYIVATTVREKATLGSQRPGVDIGLQPLAQQGHAEYTEEEVKRVRWKLDLDLLPIVGTLKQ